jgi:hypothetical protein
MEDVAPIRTSERIDKKGLERTDNDVNEFERFYWNRNGVVDCI